MVADGKGNIYTADIDANAVYRVNADGTAVVVAGNGICARTGDGGPARLASICAPRGLALDSAGNLLIADNGNSAVRQVSPDGVITTVVGGSYGLPQDNVPATSEHLQGPLGIAVGPRGQIYLAEFTRVIVVEGGIARFFAANGQTGFTGDEGPALQASISPNGLTTDASGNLFLADYSNNAIRKVGADVNIHSVVGGPSITCICDNYVARAARPA